MSTQTWQDAVAEIWQLFKETDARFKETDARFKETDAQLDKRIKETDARLDKRFAQTDQKINKLTGNFGQQWGKLIEVLVKPDSVKLFQNRGIEIKYVSPRVKRELGGETMELDLLLLNSDELVIIEVKSNLKADDIQDFLEDLADFKRFFPEYRAYRIYGAVAGLDIADHIGKSAYRRGLFVLAVTGQNMVEIKNDEKFSPKNFGL